MLSPSRHGEGMLDRPQHAVLSEAVGRRDGGIGGTEERHLGDGLMDAGAKHA